MAAALSRLRLKAVSRRQAADRINTAAHGQITNSVFGQRATGVRGSMTTAPLPSRRYSSLILAAWVARSLLVLRISQFQGCSNTRCGAVLRLALEFLWRRHPAPSAVRFVAVEQQIQK